ncbi:MULTISPECIES: serine hydrolase [Asticcacaulis]|uniref:serine hydrolase domain-containing protein n=1 Tax=Asticcacaulis TaxID=76890 RepID=UPI001AE16CC5|nr:MULTISPECIES: serine hydrolase domain-containing protein [Asticcacaulis]MBP2157643.1 D-alanyl-D-alanine carboxypeptidase [Asticcacaulis solisilvae]MDR6798688.1 D-alanyl-D-alanine carboxypeptidase [Asticcacaulis sp. BE141]
MRKAMGLAAVIMLAASVAHAGDYKPVVCSSVKPYAGAPRYAAPLNLGALPDWPEGAAPTPLAARLSATFTQARELTHAASLDAAVGTPEGRWHQADSPKLYYWASAGKTFTAIAILQAAEAGKLKLEDPVSKWIDGVPNGDVITVGHLLYHTSGLFSANEDLVVRKGSRKLTLDEELKVLKRHGAMFCPGENWRYSNSGYTLLGAILEKVEGKPYARVVTEGIIDRLGLKDIRVITPDDALADIEPLVSQSQEKAIDMRVPGPAGGIAASSLSMIAVWQGLLSGRLLKPETVQDMFDAPYPMFGQPMYYGQGVMVYRPPVKPGDAPILWLGHSGGAPGVKAVVVYSPADKAFAAVALTGDGSAEATAALLLKTLQ